jgi:hypothetical protein
MKVFKVLAFSTFIAVMQVIFSFQAMSQVTTVGKEFWFGFMENNGVPPDAPDRGVVIITASENASGTLQYAGRTLNFNLTPGQQFMHNINDVDMLHRSSGQVENKGVYIISTGNISVYAFNERFRSADGTVVLPLPTLGKDYYITSHFETMTTQVSYEANINNESTLLVVGVENDTRIEITPSVFTVNGRPANTPFVITLNRGQSYQLKARGDLTGSRVRVVGENVDECKNLAVFGGNKWVSVGDCGQANDHLFQQTYPVNTWGTEFFHIPLSGRSSGELVKVLASENGTEVLVDGNNVGTLQAGKFLTLNFNQDQVANIVTNKPSSVTVFAKSQACNDANQPLFQDGDPFMISYSPNQQLLSNITFNALQLPSITSHYVNIIVKTDAKGETWLDGQNIGNNFNVIAQNTEYSYARIRINQGVHNLRNTNGLIAYVYGFGFIESYGYAVGASLDNLNFEVEASYDFELLGNRVACYNREGAWEIIPENKLFTYFVWDFGDGSQTKVGRVVDHTYTKLGEYDIKVIASISEVSCDEQQEVLFKVQVDNTEGEIAGNTKACPLVEELTYSFLSEEAISKVVWDVVGGEIIDVDEENKQVTILWGAANTNAEVIAIPYNSEGCPGDPITLGVVINPLIDAGIPKGVEEICFDPEQTYEYTVAEKFNNRGFEWYVEEGEIIGPDDQSVVTVKWTNPGVIGKVWYREYSLFDDMCEGTSPKLEIIINPLLEAAVMDLEDVLCFGGNTGRISLDVKGGKAPYTYNWNHQESLNSITADNLLSGTYTVKVTDSFGCSVLLEDIVVEEPQLLSFKELESIGTSCFGRPDGAEVLEITGGIGPYTIDYSFAIVNNNEIRFTELEGKDYAFVVTDANGCTLPVNFRIDSPMPTVADIRVLKPSCPGQSNGELIVNTVDGQGPYTYLWQHDNSGGVTLEGIPRGVYNISIEDSRGCISNGLGEMVEQAPQIRMPTGYKPIDGLFGPVSNCDVNFTLKILNRWGNLIYSGDSGWDGRVDGQEAPIGSYTYLISIETNVNGQAILEEKNGFFTLIR